MATTELHPAPALVVAEMTADVATKHETNFVNVRNNRGFAMVDGKVVEVVRKCSKTSRVRKALDSNGPTHTIPTRHLIGYIHPERGEQLTIEDVTVLVSEAVKTEAESN